MKKNLIAAAIAATSLMTAASVFAADGTVNFTGEILDTACVVDIGANNTMTVDLGQVARTSLTDQSPRSSATRFVLKLKDCPAALTNARFKFDGQAYPGDDSVLKLEDQPGVATGVAIELSDIAATLPLYTASVTYNLVEGVNELPFYARYLKKALTVTAGPANSSATFTVNYN